LPMSLRHQRERKESITPHRAMGQGPFGPGHAAWRLLRGFHTRKQPGIKPPICFQMIGFGHLMTPCIASIAGSYKVSLFSTSEFTTRYAYPTDVSLSENTSRKAVVGYRLR
jgi:hypothetical protein